jgi:acetyl/propionyl-CoA carboxylase alpha subunit
MLGKLIASGKDRAEAIARLQRALTEFYANGIKTNAELFQRILATRDFQSGEIYTRWLDDFLSGPGKSTLAAAATANGVSHKQDAATIAAALWQMSNRAESPGASSNIADAEPRWKREARREQLRGELDQ